LKRYVCTAIQVSLQEWDNANVSLVFEETFG